MRFAPQPHESSETAVVSIAAEPGARLPDARKALIEDNDLYLEQVAELVRRMPADIYREKDNANDGIGAHVRHLLEHYESLLQAGAHVDYDQRNRDRRVETDPEHALARITAVREELPGLAVRDGSPELSVTYNCESGGRLDHLPLASCLDRELLFLVSHTVHHMALIAVLARLRSVEVPEDFGVAPSTLRHYR